MNDELMALPEPHGRQREVLALPGDGHTVVLGTAGSGKTTLAIHRASYLANEIREGAGRTLLVTFNRALVTYLEYLTPDGFGDVDVRTYHTFARGYLASRNRLGRDSICDRGCRERLVTEALERVRQAEGDEAVLRRPVEFFLDEFSWVAGHGIGTEAEYVEAERVGRGRVRLARADRPLVFRVYTQYQQDRDALGKPYDWDNMAIAVGDEFEEDESPRLYRHVVIDEGQDLSPAMVRSLVKAVPPEGSVTFFGDAAQQIYGQGMSWRAAGLRIQKVWEFEQNYRNTREIARLALAIANLPHFRDVPDIVEPREPAAAGPPPTLVQCRFPEEELEFAVDQALRVAERDRVAILYRTRDAEQGLRPRLPPDAVRLDRNMGRWNAEPGVRYGTYHSAKGLEFDTVIMPFCGSAFLPHPEWVTTKGEEETANWDGKLVYVGVTRAKARLIITWSGRLTPLLPGDPALYQVTRP